MTKRATVKRVWRDVKGSPLAAATIIGATEATVENVVDFDEDGGEFVLGDDVGTYTGIDEDLETVLGLDPPLTAAYAARTFLQEGVTKHGPWYADCYVEGANSLTTCQIMAHVRRYLSKGTRAPEEMEVVEVRLRPDGMPVIVDAPEDAPSIDGPPFLTWSKDGRIYVSTRPHRLASPYGGSLEEVFMTLGEGGEADDDVIVDLLKDGASILGVNKIVIPAGDWISPAIEPTIKELIKFEPLQVQFEQVGSDAAPGENPTLIGVIHAGDVAASGRVEVRGPAGADGTDGASAYEVAVANGFVGTEADWLDSLEGDPGAPGADGADGTDGVLSELQYEGTPLADAPILNVTGGGASLVSDGSEYTLDVPLAAGGFAWVFRDADANFSVGGGTWETDPVLQFEMDPDTWYEIFIYVHFSVQATTTGARFGFTGPGALTHLRMYGRQQIVAPGTAGTDVFTENAHGGYDIAIIAATSTISADPTPFIALQHITLITGASGGTFALRVQSEVAGSFVKVRQGSFLRYKAEPMP